MDLRTERSEAMQSGLGGTVSASGLTEHYRCAPITVSFYLYRCLGHGTSSRTSRTAVTQSCLSYCPSAQAITHLLLRHGSCATHAPMSSFAALGSALAKGELLKSLPTRRVANDLPFAVAGCGFAVVVHCAFMVCWRAIFSS